MSRQERTGFRDKAYSVWHRAIPFDLDFLDIDWVEYCHECGQTLALVELAFDNGQQDGKNGAQTRQLARRAGVPAFIVLYRTDGAEAITGFRIRRITEPQTDWRDVTPEQWTRQLLALRECHPLVRWQRDRVPPRNDFDAGWLNDDARQVWGF